MNTVVRRLSVCAVLGGALLVAALGDGSTARAQGCDPNYASTSAGACLEIGTMTVPNCTRWDRRYPGCRHGLATPRRLPQLQRQLLGVLSDGLACEWYGE